MSNFIKWVEGTDNILVMLLAGFLLTTFLSFSIFLFGYLVYKESFLALLAIFVGLPALALWYLYKSDQKEKS